MCRSTKKRWLSTEMQWLEREPPSSALLLYVNCSSITNVLILIAVSLRSTASDGLHTKLKTDIFPSWTLPLVLTFIAYSSIWQMRKVTAAHLFGLPVTFRLKGKALLVNYYAKRDHGKITTGSTEVNIFSFFSALGGSANSEGSEIPPTFSALEFSSAFPTPVLSPFLCKRLACIFTAPPTMSLLAQKENVNKSYLIMSQLTSSSLKRIIIPQELQTRISRFYVIDPRWLGTTALTTEGPREQRGQYTISISSSTTNHSTYQRKSLEIRSLKI